MRPRRFPAANSVFRLPGGTEDNDLWVEVAADETGGAYSRSVWDLTSEERQAVAEGANISLVVWGGGHPPVAVYVTDEQPGK